jgi:hypothetical protein
MSLFECVLTSNLVEPQFSVNWLNSSIRVSEKQRYFEVTSRMRFLFRANRRANGSNHRHQVLVRP